ncbi:MAG: hypothetical protein QXQ52_04495 [Candidatus Methanomethylicaceae archaeon]
MVEVKILSGARSIGGNFIRIEDKDRVLIFDQGLRFDVMEEFYRGFITPKGLKELREIGAAPKVEWYRGVNAIYISHMHLDHLGLLSNIPLRTNVYLPSISIYEVLEERWHNSPTWLSMIPRKYYVELKELRPMEIDENNIMPLPVSHSAYPAYALLYFGSDENILYTGDFRIEGFLKEEEFIKVHKGKSMLEYLSDNKDIKIDRLIIEGTNLGSIRVPISPIEEEEMLKRILKMHSLIIATIHQLDLEYIFLLDKLAFQTGRSIYIASEGAINLMKITANFLTKPKTIIDYVKTLTHFETTELTDIDKNSILITSYYEMIDVLRDLRDVGILPKDSAVILSESEPRVEEAQEYEVMMNWLLRLSTQAYLMRTSGHYYPHEFKAIINIINPKRIDIVHTKTID